jgi:hypothetical protein
MPTRYKGVYWPSWTSQDLTTIPDAGAAGYNVIYLFVARYNGTQTFGWDDHLAPAGQCATCRGRGQRIVPSLGGAGGQLPQPLGQVMADNICAAVVNLNTALGGTLVAPAIDGLDFNTYEGQAMSANDVTWYSYMGKKLKTTFGSSFIISTPPGIENAYINFCRDWYNAGGLDIALPQYYDNANNVLYNTIVGQTNYALTQLPGQAVGVGFAANYDYGTGETLATCQSVCTDIGNRIRGVMEWESRGDGINHGWTFSSTVLPIISGQAGPAITGGGGTPAPVVNKVGTLVDSFATGANWTPVNSAAISGSKATLVCNFGAANKSTLTTVAQYDVIASSVYMQFSQLPRAGALGPAAGGGTGTSESGMYLQNTNGDYVMAIITGSNIFMRKSLAGVATEFTVAYDPTKPFIRIREAGGTIFWERGPDGTTWTTMASNTHAMATSLGAVNVRLESWYWGNEDVSVSPMGSFVVEGVNSAVAPINVPIPTVGATQPPPTGTPKIATFIEDFSTSTNWSII